MALRRTAHRRASDQTRPLRKDRLIAMVASLTTHATIHKIRIPRKKSSAKRRIWDRSRLAVYHGAKESIFSRARLDQFARAVVREYAEDEGARYASSDPEHGCLWMAGDIADWVFLRAGTWREPSRMYRPTKEECARGGRAGRGHRPANRLDDTVRIAVHRLRREGLSLRRIAAQVGHSKSFVFNVLKEPEPTAAEEPVPPPTTKESIMKPKPRQPVNNYQDWLVQYDRDKEKGLHRRRRGGGKS